MDYKTTLNLPKTDFPMKADLPNREGLILKRWQEMGLYSLIRKKLEGMKKFILHDGPPYANGNIHMGHALNKILKDIVIRYKTMRGFDSPYVPGWDCHGLPVEHQLFKELKLTKYDIDQVAFRKKAHDYAMKYVSIQRDQFKRLGILGDWERPYLTLSRDYESEIIRSFGKLVEKGYIYKDLKPVNWCTTCETALAEAEVEYEDKKSPSIYVKFRAIDDDAIAKIFGVEDALSSYFVIWTTTPWTLVANAAIAVHPELEYALVENKSRREKYIILKDLTQLVLDKAGIKDFEVLKTAKGRALENSEAAHPFIDRYSRVVMAEYVSVEDGTGCVHTAPGHGMEDYFTGKRYGLPTIMPVDKRGRFDSSAGAFSNMEIVSANGAILEELKTRGNLLYAGEVLHSYPHCWRCKKPIIFRATEQYFMKIDHLDLRKKILSAICSAVKWVPEAGNARISAMVEGRPDWCLSRQRYWGVPIVAFYCRKCGASILDPKAIANVASLAQREGADVWFAKDVSELVSEDMKCCKCGGMEFGKENDILDVWFDSGVSHQAVLKKNPALDYPCELYLEGSDQHRGWFQSAMITGMAIDGQAPYRSVLTHGFVVDGEGKKMSKSLGNVITPEQVMKRYGADILRLWVASSDYSEDIRLSDEILTRLADAYRKIRNTFRYLLSNLYDFDPARDMVAYEMMLEPDRWILSRLAKLIEESAVNYESYAFHKVYRDVYNLCVSEISSVYLDILKDRMYTFKANSAERRSGQSAMYEVLSGLVRVMAPLLSMTTEEVWANMRPGTTGESVHLEKWPDESVYRKWLSDSLDEKWVRLASLRETVLKSIEDKRQAGVIGSSLEAKVVLSSKDKECSAFLLDNREMLRYLFIVSDVRISDEPDKSAEERPELHLFVQIEKADGQKCARCWNYSVEVGKDSKHPSLCERCVKNI